MVVLLYLYLDALSKKKKNYANLLKCYKTLLSTSFEKLIYKIDMRNVLIHSHQGDINVHCSLFFSYLGFVLLDFPSFFK